LSCLVYLLLGFMGAPVFAGFTGGVGKLLGPTGGYIIGYLAVSVVSGLAVEKFRSRFLHLFGMVLGTAICYGIGTVWYCFVARVGVSSAVTLCVLPFIPGDLVKMVVSLTFGPALRSRLEKAGLLKM
jgi:biotin transport system substrate-specific component